MLHEFAVDPTLFGTLANDDAIDKWSERFDLQQGRLIARYPSKWERHALKSIPESAPDRLRTSLVERIRRLKEDNMFLNLNRVPFDGGKCWIDNAIEQDQVLPFSGIIANENPAGLPGILLGNEIKKGTPEFAVEHGGSFPSNARDMARCVSLVLREAERVVFVDHFFDPAEKRFRNPLQAFIEKAYESKPGNPLRELEYHLTNKKGVSQSQFQGQCEEHLPRIVPAGTTLKLIRWRSKPLEESIHQRMILTSLCGISFDPGLDEREGDLTKVRILPESDFRRFIEQYREGSAAFEFVDKVEIVGQRNYKGNT